MAKSTTFSAPFLCSSLTQDTKILLPRTSFRLKAPYIENIYEIYYITCADRSSMPEGCNGDVKGIPGGVIRTGGLASEGVRSVWSRRYTA